MVEDNLVDLCQLCDFLLEIVVFFDQVNMVNMIDVSYEYFLLFFNLCWDLNDEMLVCFVVSEVIVLVDIVVFNLNQVIVFEFGYVVDEMVMLLVVFDIVLGVLCVYGGNLNFDLVEFINIDFFYEWYFGDDGLFFVFLFYKDIWNIIVYGDEIIDVVMLDGYMVLVIYFGNLNFNDGMVEGLELFYQQFFIQWLGLWGNLGVQVNLILFDFEMMVLLAVNDIDGDGVEGFFLVYCWDVSDLLGLFDMFYNLIGIYQDDCFEVCVVYNWCFVYYSLYCDYVMGNLIFQDDIGFFDVLFCWDVMDNLQFCVQVVNLFDMQVMVCQEVDVVGQIYVCLVFDNDCCFEFGLSYIF